jgi:hypothetical protein
MAALQSRGVALSGVHPSWAGTILKRCDAPRQKVMQHHHHRQAVAHQVLDPLDHGPEGHVLPRGLLPGSLLGHRGLGRQHQAVMDIGLCNHLVFPPAIPLARADGRDVRDRPLGSDLEVVGAHQARSLPGPPYHAEHQEQGDQRPHADKHLTKVDEDHHLNV